MAKRILIVDDEPQILNLIRHRLESEGYRISVAEDGQRALRMVEVTKPDLIILDVVLPELSGAEVYERLRDNKKTQNIPIIFLTALKDKKDDHHLGYEFGAHTIFAKPFDPQELLGTIRDILR